jgi:hypothetical protein
MNNDARHNYQQQQQRQQLQQRRYRAMEDFNAFSSLDANDTPTDNRLHSAYPMTSIERSPIRAHSDRAQSAQHYWDESDSRHNYQRNFPNFQEDVDLDPGHNNTSDCDHSDDATVTRMLMIRNGTLKPKAKRSRRTVSAPHIPPFDDHNNDLLDLLDIDDNDQIQLKASDKDYHHNRDSLNRNKAVRSHSHDDVYIASSVTNAMNTPISVPPRQGEYPFFHYVDHSQEVDLTPDVPLTAMGRVPTFLAKLHAILLRPELQHIVAWLPHGRSWKVYNAVEFEKQVIAVYFEFTKHPNSSFFRQAKLWGFLRIKQDGMDHDSYYHPRFLRGLPYLCKDVRRPPASQLPDVPPIEQEPNLTVISEIYPVPPSSQAIHHDPTIRLDWFMKGKQQLQQQQTKKPDALQYPPPGKEGIAKKTSSSTSTSTDYSSTLSIVKRKRSTQEGSNEIPDMAVNHHHQLRHQYDIDPVEIHVPSMYGMNHRIDDVNLNMDDDDDEPPIDDDLGLNLDPYFCKGYHLYPFYDYVDYSTNMDMYPFQPYTDVGQEPSFPILLHAMLVWQQRSNSTEPCIQWQPHGRAWKICSVLKLEAEILPIFFKNHGSNNNTTTNHSNFAGAFFRHVTRWGFKRIDQQPHHHTHTSHHIPPSTVSDFGCYYHPKFLRGLPHLGKDWNMNDTLSASSLSSSQLISEDDDCHYNRTNINNSDPNCNEYPDPDFTKISQLHPVPDYDPKLTVDDLLGPDWFMG